MDREGNFKEDKLLTDDVAVMAAEVAMLVAKFLVGLLPADADAADAADAALLFLYRWGCRCCVQCGCCCNCRP